MARTIKLHIDDNLDLEKYAALGNAIYFLAQASLPEGTFHLVCDSKNTSDELNAEYERQGNENPWG